MSVAYAVNSQLAKYLWRYSGPVTVNKTQRSSGIQRRGPPSTPARQQRTSASSLRLDALLPDEGITSHYRVLMLPIHKYKRSIYANGFYMQILMKLTRQHYSIRLLSLCISRATHFSADFSEISCIFKFKDGCKSFVQMRQPLDSVQLIFNLRSQKVYQDITRLVLTFYYRAQY